MLAREANCAWRGAACVGALLLVGGCLATGGAYQALAKPDRRPSIEAVQDCRFVEQQDGATAILMRLRLSNDRDWTSACAPSAKHDGEYRCDGGYNDMPRLARDAPSCSARVLGSINWARVQVSGDHMDREVLVPLPEWSSKGGEVLFMFLSPVLIATDIVTSPLQAIWVVSQVPKIK